MTSRQRSTSVRRFGAGRAITVAAVALLVAPAVVDAAGPRPAGAATSCPADAEGQSIQMWSPLTGPDGDTMSELANEFSSANDAGVSVEHVAQPEYMQRLGAAAAAGDLPAMTIVRATNIGELAARNVLTPFSDEAMAILGDDFAAEFPENAWGVGNYEDERFAVPLDVHPLVMYYNRDMFEAAGLEEPGTEPLSRDEFEAALDALDESGVQPIALGTAFQAATLFQSFIVQFGGALTNEDGSEVTYADEAGVQALEYLAELKEQYSPADIAGAGDPEVAFFTQQQAAIVIHGPWHISAVSQLDFVGYAPIPQVGDSFAVWAGSHQLALTSDDPGQQAAAACWIGWLSDNSVQWAAAGQVPARDSAREADELAEVAEPISRFASVIDQAIALPQVPELEGALWDEFGPVVDALVMGEVGDIAGALEEAAARSQQVIDQNIERYGS